MTFDKQAEYRKQLEHLVSMAQKPEWKSYAWSRAKALDAEEPGLFRGISADLTKAMSQKPTPASDSAPEGQMLTKQG